MFETCPPKTFIKDFNNFLDIRLGKGRYKVLDFHRENTKFLIKLEIIRHGYPEIFDGTSKELIDIVFANDIVYHY